MRRASLSQERVCISMYDTSQDGTLDESQLERYLADLVPSLPQLASIESDFKAFYTCSAVRKFFFNLERPTKKFQPSRALLDKSRAPRVAITDVLLSPILTEFFQMQQSELSQEDLSKNWFSLYTSLKVYAQYVELDTDRNGMLNVDELSKFARSRYSRIFIERVFQEYITY